MLDLIEKYGRTLHIYCYQTLWTYSRDKNLATNEAEDASREVFVRSFEKIGDLKKERAYLGWIMSIAYNLCMEILKEQIRESVSENGEIPDSDPDFSISTVSEPEDPFDELVKVEIERAVIDALNELDDLDRQILILRYYQDMSHEEVASTLGIRVNTSKTRFSRIKDKLSQKLSYLKEDIQ